MQDPVETLRLLHNLLRIGTIADVDPASARARLADGDLLSAWLPWLERRAGSTRDWDPPTVGEQALLLSPGGDPAAGVFVTGLFSTANPAPADDPAMTRRVYPDGAIIEYDHQRHHLQATIPGSATLDADTDVGVHAGGAIEAIAVADITAETQANITATAQGQAKLTAAAGAVVNADTVINGNLQLNGAFAMAGGYTATITSPVQFVAPAEFTASMTHNGKAIDSSHTHGGVQSGGSTTGSVS